MHFGSFTSDKLWPHVNDLSVVEHIGEEGRSEIVMLFREDAFLLTSIDSSPVIEDIYTLERLKL